MLTPEHWPTQAEADRFYGDPRGRDGKASPAWCSANLVKITPPYKVWFGDTAVTQITIHKKCAESALRILTKAWELVSKDQARADELGISKFSGSFNYRVIRGGSRLSMHAYGCAWDWWASENWLGDKTPEFNEDHPFNIAHKSEGWTWGGRWNRPDGMHWQAARVHA